MSELDDTPPPMDAGLRSLLRNTRASFDDEASAHAGPAFARLAQALPGLAAPGGGGGDGGGGDGGGGGGVGAGAGAAASAGLAKLALPVIVSLMVGGGIGAVVTLALGPTRERIVYVDRPAPNSAVPLATFAPESPSSTAPGMRVEDLPGVAPAVASAASSVAVSPSERIAAERLLLDDARSAFASGDYPKALLLLRRHGERFPAGVLAEEREALTVRALAALGKNDEADARARAFVAKYPESIMRPAVESAVQRRQ